MRVPGDLCRRIPVNVTYSKRFLFLRYPFSIPPNRGYRLCDLGEDGMQYGFQIVDVFGHGAFSGNPLAVVAEADGLDTDTMQRITRWLNLSETSFLLRPEHPDA